MNTIDFDRTHEYIEELKRKKFFSFYDYDYAGHVEERAYVSQDEKGVFAGVVETKNERAQASVVTFFEINYITGDFNIWNGKGKKLKHTTQNFNRVFRNSEVIDEIGNENLSYLKELADAFNFTAGWSSSHSIVGGILRSLRPGGEIIYTLAKQLAYNGEPTSSIMGNLVSARDQLINADAKVNYKNILKVLGLTKADLKNETYKSVSFGMSEVDIPDVYRSPMKDYDFSTGNIVDKKYWQHTSRGFLSMCDIMKSLSDQYGYLEQYDEIVRKAESPYRYGDLSNVIQIFDETNTTLNLEKMLRYFYIDVYSHQGFQQYREVVSTYYDYLRLVRDIPNFVVYPKYLAVAHDIAAKAKAQSSVDDEVDVIKVTERLKDVESLYRVKDSKGENKTYPVVVLRAGNEIRHEATNQSNCLAGYIGTVSKGHSIILSVKDPDVWESDNELKSFISVEVRMPSDSVETPYLAQAFKTYNNSLDDREMGILMAIMKKNSIDVDKHITGFGTASKTVQDNAKVIKISDIKVETHPTIEKELAAYNEAVRKEQEAGGTLASYIGRL